MALSFKALIEKFNPYHDSKGRFTTAGGATLFTIRTKDGKRQSAADKAAEREKHLTAATMPTEAQAKTLKGIETRTRNLKKEQLRVVDREGNIILEKHGGNESVNFTVGEARDNFYGNVVIHNHPKDYGGTFSLEDIRTLGYGATEMRVAAAEGTYIMRNTRFGRKYDYSNDKTWLDMQEDLKAASSKFKDDSSLRKEVKARYQADYDENVSSWAKKWVEAKDRGASKEELQKFLDGYDKAKNTWDAETKPKIETEIRRAYVDQYHDWYKTNAYKYGMEYQFFPVKTRTQKGLMEEPVMKAADAGDVVLDEQMNRDIRELTEKIMDEITNPKKAKSFADTIEKFNPYHDKQGRFTTADGAASFTYRSNKPLMANAINRAIEREKQRTSGGDGTAKIKNAEAELKGVLKEGAVVKFEGMDPELAQETTDSIKRVLEKYPTCKDAYSGFTTDEPEPGYFTEHEGTYACYVPNTAMIHLNSAVYSDKAKLKAKYQTSVDNKHFPEGTTYNSAVVHEMGHAVDRYVSLRVIDPLRVNWGGETVSARIWNTDIKAAKKKGQPMTGESIRENLSRYAGKNPHEYFAEAFSEALTSPTPRKTAQSIVKRMESYINKAAKKDEENKRIWGEVSYDW